MGRGANVPVIGDPAADDHHSMERLGHSIVTAGLNVHKSLGPGLLESAYERCLVHELQSQGLVVQRQVFLPIHYNGTEIDAGYRLDLLIEQQIIVEVKAVESLSHLHVAQVLTYLKLSGYRVAFLMNFNVALFKLGVRRLVL